MKSDLFKDVLEQFETEEIKLYCKDMINKMPDYIMEIPSSTSYKYHNKTQCQPGGQALHILMVGTIMNYILGLDYIRVKFNKEKQRDCMRTAVLLHDAIKCGLDGGQHTVHEHPILAQKWIEETVVDNDIDIKLKKYIGRLIASHSGQWTTSSRSETILPSLENDEQFFVHLADYLGSRANLDMIYSDEQIACINTSTIMPFGKYKGYDIKDIPMDYLNWCIDNLEMNQPLANSIKKILGR